jgi:hypothetical protein
VCYNCCLHARTGWGVASFLQSWGGFVGHEISVLGWCMHMGAEDSGRYWAVTAGTSHIYIHAYNHAIC